jgi:glycosyltransferase involved in cell wall biosynthesis
MKVWVVIPAYNEANSLVRIIEELKKRDVSIMVIDDGSKDRTFNISRKNADIVIRNQKNFGKGRALKEGITYLLEHSQFDYIITMDADGQHSPTDLDKFLEEAEKGKYFVIGNRMETPLGMPKVRIITNKFMSWFISKIIGQKIPDTQCGFRLVKREVLEKIIIQTNKFEIESEILIKAAKSNFPIESIPIRSIYFKHKRSRINPFIDTLRFLKFIFHLGNGNA